MGPRIRGGGGAVIYGLNRRDNIPRVWSVDLGDPLVWSGDLYDLLVWSDDLDDPLVWSGDPLVWSGSEFEEKSILHSFFSRSI